MGAWVRSAFGWAGLAALVAGLVLLWSEGSLFDENAAGGSDSLTSLAWWMLALGAVAVATVVYRAFAPEDEHEPEWWRLRMPVVVRSVICVVGLVLCWLAFPARHLVLSVDGLVRNVYPEPVFAAWTGVCVVALGLLLSVFGTPRLSVRPWHAAVAGVPAGAMAVALVWAGVPVVQRSVTVEHTVAAGGEAVPIPEAVTRVGWTWEPTRDVLGVSAGPRGPVVRHLDGFVGLDGATGEELWSYRLPYARKVTTGVFVGTPERVHLLHREDPLTETRTLVVLDTATGAVVREALWEDERFPAGLTADAHIRFSYEEAGPVLAARPLYPGAPGWELPLEDEPPGRVCLEGHHDGVRVYGDRVLVTRVCLDAEHLPEGRRDVLHDPYTVPDDAVETVIVLDAVTGGELWRHTGVPEDLVYPDPPGLGLPVHAGAEPVVLALDGVFDLATGEPLGVRPALPEEPLESSDRLWAVDTAGAVTLRDPGEEEPSLVLRTDANGEVVQRIEGDRSLLRHQLENPLPLAETVVAPVVFHDRLPENVRAVALLPWAEGLDEGDVEWIDLGTLSEEENSGHGVLAVPGSVVSYVRNSTLPLHGLVP